MTQSPSKKEKAFLVGLVDPELGLLPEYPAAKVYWLFHDNYLAAKVLEKAATRKSPQRIWAAIYQEGF